MRSLENIYYYISRLMNRRPVAVYQSTINKYASIGNGAQIYKSSVGRYSYIYNSEVIETSIGQFCSIAGGCVIGGGVHPTTWVSTSPVFYGNNVLHTNFFKRNFDEYIHTEIGNDVWIGSKCLIKGGIKIGDGAIIGMGSVVTHNVPAYEIWAGNPAKFIRKRFDDAVIDFLERFKWWELSDEKLSEIGKFFNDPYHLMKYEGEIKK